MDKTDEAASGLLHAVTNLSQEQYDALVRDAMLWRASLSATPANARAVAEKCAEIADEYRWGDLYRECCEGNMGWLLGKISGAIRAYAATLPQPATQRSEPVTDAMVERALAAANGAMVDTRRHWTDGDKTTVRAMLDAALSEKPAIPEGWKLVCEKCGADTSGPCGWPNNCLAGLVVPPSLDGN